MKDICMSGVATSMGSLWAKRSFLLSPRSLRLSFSQMKRLEQFGVAGPTWWHKQVGHLKSSYIWHRHSTWSLLHANSVLSHWHWCMQGFTGAAVISWVRWWQTSFGSVPEVLLRLEMRGPSAFINAVAPVYTHWREAASLHHQVTGVSEYIWASKDWSAGWVFKSLERKEFCWKLASENR